MCMGTRLPRRISVAIAAAPCAFSIQLSTGLAMPNSLGGLPEKCTQAQITPVPKTAALIA